MSGAASIFVMIQLRWSSVAIQRNVVYQEDLVHKEALVTVSINLSTRFVERMLKWRLVGRPITSCARISTSSIWAFRVHCKQSCLPDLNLECCRVCITFYGSSRTDEMYAYSWPLLCYIIYNIWLYFQGCNLNQFDLRNRFRYTVLDSIRECVGSEISQWLSATSFHILLKVFLFRVFLFFCLGCFCLVVFCKYRLMGNNGGNAE